MMTGGSSSTYRWTTRSPTAGSAQAAVAAAVAAGALAWGAPSLHNLVARNGHRYARRRLRHEREVALTFDDGPQPGATPAMLELLARLDVQATFFVVGEHALEHPQIVREIVSEGHVVQCHGQRHRNHLLRAPTGIMRDMRDAQRELGRITGAVPMLYRPPQGVVTWPTLMGVRRSFAALVLWSHWGRDWRRAATAESIAAEVAGAVRGGDILLLHDADWYGAGSAAHTRDAVQTVVERVRSADLSFVTLREATQLA